MHISIFHTRNIDAPIFFLYKSPLLIFPYRATSPGKGWFRPFSWFTIRGLSHEYVIKSVVISSIQCFTHDLTTTTILANGILNHLWNLCCLLLTTLQQQITTTPTPILCLLVPWRARGPVHSSSARHKLHLHNDLLLSCVGANITNFCSVTASKYSWHIEIGFVILLAV